MLKPIQKFENALIRVEAKLLTVLVLVMLGLAVYNVLYRNAMVPLQVWANASETEQTETEEPRPTSADLEAPTPPPTDEATSGQTDFDEAGFGGGFGSDDSDNDESGFGGGFGSDDSDIDESGFGGGFGSGESDIDEVLGGGMDTEQPDTDDEGFGGGFGSESDIDDEGFGGGFGSESDIDDEGFGGGFGSDDAEPEDEGFGGGFGSVEPDFDEDRPKGSTADRTSETDTDPNPSTIGKLVDALKLEWIDVLLRHLVLIVGFLGAMLATHRRKHITVDALSKVLKGRVLITASLLTTLLSIVVCVFLALAGADLVKLGIEFPKEIAWWSDEWHMQLVFPIGFSFLAFHFVVRALEAAVALKDGDDSFLHEAPMALPAPTPATAPIEAKGEEE